MNGKYKDMNFEIVQDKNKQVNLDDLLLGHKLFFESNYDEAMQFFEQNMENDIRRYACYVKAYFAKVQIECIPPFNHLSLKLKDLFFKVQDLFKIKREDNYDAFQEAYFKLTDKERNLIDWGLCQVLQANLISYKPAIEEDQIQFINHHFLTIKPKFQDLTQQPLLISNNDIDKENKVEKIDQYSTFYYNYRSKNFYSFIDTLCKIPESDLKPIDFETNTVDIDSYWILLSIIKQQNDMKTPNLFEFIKRALILFPKSDFIWLVYGDCLIYNSQYKESRVCYDKCLEFNPNNYVAMNNKGYSYEYDHEYQSLDGNDSYNQRYEIAIELYSEATRMCSSYWIFYNNIGVCYKSLNQRFIAAEHFLQSVEINHAYQNGASRLLEELAFIQKDYPDLKNLIIRSFILMDKQQSKFDKLLTIFKNDHPMVLQESILQASLNYPFNSHALLNQIKYEADVILLLPIIEQQNEFFQFNIMVTAYSKNLKQFFDYQPTHFLWDLFFD